MTERSRDSHTPNDPIPPMPREARRDRTIQESRHDTYRARGKLREPTACPQCGAVFHKGRWTWGERPPRAHEALCPACQRMNDQLPAGQLSVRGSFLTQHKTEILGLARNAEAQAKAEHPLSRIMTVEEQEDALVIATTDTHLPQRIGEALHHAYHGELDIHYSRDQQFIRVTWRRELGLEET